MAKVVKGKSGEEPPSKKALRLKSEKVKLPSPELAERISEAKAKVASLPKRVSVLLAHEPGDNAALGNPHTDSTGFFTHLQAVFGSRSNDFGDLLLGQIAGCVGPERDRADQASVNAALAGLEAIGAKDEIEAMLGAQMVATHVVAMQSLARVKHATDPKRIEIYNNLATKMLRTFTTQLEALAKLRRGGQQKVTVEHVHVYPGGQAIVGSVTQGAGGGSIENGRQPHAITHALQPEVWSENPQRETLPITGNGKGSVSNARRGAGKRSTIGTA